MLHSFVASDKYIFSEKDIIVVLGNGLIKILNHDNLVEKLPFGETSDEKLQFKDIKECITLDGHHGNMIKSIIITPCRKIISHSIVKGMIQWDTKCSQFSTDPLIINCSDIFTAITSNKLTGTGYLPDGRIITSSYCLETWNLDSQNRDKCIHGIKYAYDFDSDYRPMFQKSNISILKVISDGRVLYGCYDSKLRMLS